MAVGFAVGDERWPVGRADFLTAFFSTASVRLEPAGWGTRFPRLMGELYLGELAVDGTAEALDELAAIRAELAEHPPSALVWDIHDRSARPPWRADIAPTITSLANYFVTADGDDLIDVLTTALGIATRSAAPLRIVTGV